MIIGVRRVKKIESDLELEKMIRPFQPRKDSSFHTKDKPDYSYLLGVMNRNRIKK